MDWLLLTLLNSLLDFHWNCALPSSVGPERVPCQRIKTVGFCAPVSRYGICRKKKGEKKKRTRTIKQRNIELREDISWLIRNLLHLDFTRDSISEWRGNGESLSRECLYGARDLRFHSMWETIKVDLFHFQAKSDRWIDRWIIHETFPWLRSKYRFAISFTVLFFRYCPFDWYCPFTIPRFKVYIYCNMARENGLKTQINVT